ncbi:MAG: MoaD/ThiS family protein, partial [Clostridiales Family XIII bacterium]|nr:MoaD/ThiS family protein [Clostridiales Family XIII bacterium]
RRFTEGKGRIEAQGETVGECLNNLMLKYPGLKGSVYKSENKLYAGIFVNGEVIRDSGLGRKVGGEDEILILVNLSGG